MSDSLIKYLENLGVKLTKRQPAPKSAEEDKQAVLLKIAGGLKHFVPGREIRRDDAIKQQIYLVSMGFFDMKTHSSSLHFSQALANPKTKLIEVNKIHEFWVDWNRSKKGRRKETFKLGHCSVIDEISKRFYFVHGRHRSINILIYELSFDTEEDNFGYRRVTVKGAPRNIVMEEQKLAVLQKPLFLVGQGSGQLITVCSSISNPLCHVSAVVQFTKDGLSAALVPGKGKFKASGKKVSAENIFISRLGHLVIVFSSETDRNMCVCSYNKQLDLLNCLKIDKYELLSTNRSIREQLRNNPFRFQVLGQVYKYMVFLFQGFVVLAVKWPKDWYARKQLLPVHPLRLMVECPPTGTTGFTSGHLMGNDLYCLFDSDDGHTLTKRRLGQKLKDYRCCTFCGAKETHKRRNKLGKRITNFKVCRICKKQKKHRPYCSYECIKKDWKEHKITHE